MRAFGPVVSVLAAVAFLLAAYFEVASNGFTPLAYVALGLLLLAVPTAIASARDLTNRDGRVGGR